MRGKKAKAIRAAVRQLVPAESIGESTQYDVISHPQKLGPMGQRYNPRQIVVKSAFRRMVKEIKREYRKITTSGIPATLNRA